MVPINTSAPLKETGVLGVVVDVELLQPDATRNITRRGIASLIETINDMAF
jgi:hypothetical protein